MSILDEQFKLWAAWFAELSDEISFLLMSTATFWQLQEFVRENTKRLDEVPWHWFNAWTASNWSTATAARVRALGDPNRDTKSLHSLLQRIKGNPQVFTRARYVALTGASDSHTIERSNHEFDERFGTGPQIDPALVATDIAAIDNALATVRDYVDKRVAHLDRAWGEKRIQGDPLNKALEILREIVEKYTYLFELNYAFGKSGFWLAGSGRYDSGLVTGADETIVQDPDNAFALPYIRIHSGGGLDPNRVAPRTLWNFSLGADLARYGIPVSLQAAVLNAFDKKGVYNVLSTFGGTHVIPPRTYAGRARISF